MGLGEKDGEEFDQVKVALIPVLELDVPDEFVLGGHVMVSDHAAVPPRAELHPDESSDEMVRGITSSLEPHDNFCASNRRKCFSQKVFFYFAFGQS